jgi:hypothetical protein
VHQNLHLPWLLGQQDQKQDIPYLFLHCPKIQGSQVAKVSTATVGSDKAILALAPRALWQHVGLSLFMVAWLPGCLAQGAKVSAATTVYSNDSTYLGSLGCV